METDKPLMRNSYKTLNFSHWTIELLHSNNQRNKQPLHLQCKSHCCVPVIVRVYYVAPTRLKPKQLQKNKHIPIIEVIRTSTLKLIPILLNNEKTVIHQSLRTCDGKFFKAIYNFQHGFNQFGYRDDCIYQTCSSQS